MSILRIILNDDHIKLIKQLKVNIERNDDSIETPVILRESPFGGDDVYNDMFLILYGRPETDSLDTNPWDDQETPWDDKQLEYMKKLLGELPYTLDIVLCTGSFETGNFKTKTYERNWKKVDN